jgi:hypothetical protein
MMYVPEEGSVRAPTGFGKEAALKLSFRRPYNLRMMTSLILLLALSPAYAADSPPPFAEVVHVKGFASLEPEHTNLRPGQKLAEGARITVMSNSSVRLFLSDGVALEVGPDSELELKRTRQKIPFARLVHGMLLAALKPAESSAKKDRFQVRTHKVSLGVRGTEFFVRQDLNQPAFLCVCAGKVHAKWAEGEIELLAQKPHEHAVHIHHTRRKATKSKDMGKDHDDKQLETLRKLL